MSQKRTGGESRDWVVFRGQISEAGRSKQPELSGAHHVLPESGGQRDRDEVEIAREEVPKPHSDKVWLGNLPSRDPSGRAALLTQEGVALWT